jgi:hypothetical protein
VDVAAELSFSESLLVELLLPQPASRDAARIPVSNKEITFFFIVFTSLLSSSLETFRKKIKKFLLLIYYTPFC